MSKSLPERFHEEALPIIAGIPPAMQQLARTMFYLAWSSATDELCEAVVDLDDLDDDEDGEEVDEAIMASYALMLRRLDEMRNEVVPAMTVSIALSRAQAIGR